MKSMSLYAAYENGGSKNTRTVPEEVVSDKEVNEGAVDESYVTTVNCYAKSIEFSLKPVDPENIEKVKVGDEELNTNFLDEYEYTKEGLAVGNNKFTIDVKTKDGKNYTYNMIVRKKPQLNIEKIEVEDGKEGKSKDLRLRRGRLRGRRPRRPGGRTTTRPAGPKHTGLVSIGTYPGPMAAVPMTAVAAILLCDTRPRMGTVSRHRRSEERR